MDSNDILSDKKKKGRPSIGVDTRVTVRLTDDLDRALYRFGHDYCIYPDNDMSVNRSSVIRKLIEKFSAIKKEYFEPRDSDGEMLFDIMIEYLLTANEDYYKWADMTDDENEKQRYLNDGETFAKIAYLLNNDFNYNDNRPDVAQKRFKFGYGDKTGRYIGISQERKYDKKYKDKLWKKKREVQLKRGNK